ncbi:XVIPCD domain-containing protein [Xanthomonas cassavae]|uniref:XVIPCD domain-containing protein n=1 Tax=Xanthomonas cassavae TaxID=56450 RepID=UPI003CCDC1E0
MERLHAAPGPAAGMDGERLALGSVVAAREHGLQRVDHVLLGNDSARGFVVQGALDSPAHLRASFDAKAVREAPVAASLQRLQALDPGTQRCHCAGAGAGDTAGNAATGTGALRTRATWSQLNFQMGGVRPQVGPTAVLAACAGSGTMVGGLAGDAARHT